MRRKWGKLAIMFSEFEAFIDKGNAMDLAVGVIVGAAFGKIPDSLVNDIIMVKQMNMLRGTKA